MLQHGLPVGRQAVERMSTLIAVPARACGETHFAWSERAELDSLSHRHTVAQLICGARPRVVRESADICPVG